MTRMNLSALLLGATALTLPLGTSAYAQTQQQTQQGQQQTQQGQQAAATQQTQELGACERLYRLIEDAAGEEFLEDFREAAQIADRQQADECALVIRQVEQAGGISREAVAEGRGAQFLTETETFRATDTVTETVEIDRRAIVEGEVLVRQPIPEVEIEEGQAEVQVRERPGRISVDEEPASIEIRQQPANVRVAVPRPTVMIEQAPPEIIITMPAPGVSIERDQPQVDVVMAEPTVTVRQEDPQVDVNVDARLVDANVAIAEPDQPRVQTRAERLDAAGQQATQEEAEVAVRKVKPSIRFMTSDVQDEVEFNRARPRITYQSAEPNVEVTFNDEPRVEIRQTGEPRVRIRRQGDDRAGLQQQTGEQQGQQAQQATTQAQQGQQATAQGQQGQQGQQATTQGQQATTQAQQGQQEQTSLQTQSGQQGFTAEVARGEEVEVVALEQSIRTAGQALEQEDFAGARAGLERAGQQIDMAMEQADERTRQEMQGLREQVDLAAVSVDERDTRGAQTALYDVEANLQQNRNRWFGQQQAGVTTQPATQTTGTQPATQTTGRLSIEDTNRLLRMEEGYEYGEAQLTNMRAGDLRGADVHTVRGEEVGDIEEIVTNNGQLYAIVSHGGFLGIGEDDVAIPLERIAVRGNEVILLGLTEEQLQRMPEYNFETDQAFSANDPVEIGRFE